MKRPIKKVGRVRPGLFRWPWGVVNHDALKGSLLLIVPLALLTLFGQLFLSNVFESVIISVFIDMLAVIGLFIFFGNSGVATFGQVAFMGLGAHLGALLVIDPSLKAMRLPDLPVWLGQMNLEPLWALAIVVVVVGFFAILIGLPLVRLGGVAASITTLCLLIVMHSVFRAAKTYTAGTRTLLGMPQFVDIWIAFAFVAAAILMARIFRDSVYGLELRASREDELGAQSIGININRRRLIAWAIHAMISAAAGYLLGCYLGIVSHNTFYLNLTFILIAMMIVGGMTTVSGAVVGTLVLSVTLEFLRHFESGVNLGFLQLPEMFGLTTAGMGFAILAVMFWQRNGLLPYLELDERLTLWLKRRRDRAAIPAAGPGYDSLPDTGFIRPMVKETNRSDECRQLIAECVSRKFGGLKALHDVSLELNYGEILGLIGPNGAGKTTLLNLMAGADFPTAGRLVVDEADITGLPAYKRARKGIGRTFQNIRLFPHLTVMENIGAGATASRANLGRMTPEKWAREILNDFNLEAKSHKMAGTLAYGRQRTLEIARAMAIRPNYLLLDEPAAGMNRPEKNHFVKVIEFLRNRYGLGILVVEHDIRLIAELCERVVVLNEGEIIAVGSPGQIQQNPKVIQAYIGGSKQTTGG
jgi:branched-chain amino acid transport system permease protein